METIKTDTRIVVAGAGISGLTAALHLAEKGFRITLVDRSDGSGGILPLLDIQFPNDHCGMCRILPMIGREGAQDFCLKRGVFHENIRFLPHTLVTGVTGNPGSLEVSLSPASGNTQESLDPLTNVAAVILAGGGALFDPSGQVLYNMANLPNVVTALDFERLTAGSPLYQTTIPRPSDSAPANRVAWIQCVGSRNLGQGSPFCASACCMFAVKEAVHAKKLTGNAMDAAIFYMDMRTFGREYQKYRDEAEKHRGVRFVRCRVHSIEAAEQPGDLDLFYVDSRGVRQKETFDMVVLSTGKSASVKEQEALDDLAKVKGVHLLQSATEFRDISDSVKGAQSVVSEVETLIRDLHPSTGPGLDETVAQTGQDASVLASKPNPLLVLVRGDDPLVSDDVWERIHELAAAGLQGNAFQAEHLDQETLERIRAHILEKKINRVLMAGVRPSTTLPGKAGLVRKLGLPIPFIGIADLTPYFVNTGSAEDASAHALSMVDASLRYLKRARIYPELGRKTVKKALVIGGGPAGLMAAKSLADTGCAVVIVDRAESLGGNSRYITGDGVRSGLDALLRDISANPGIEILTGYTIKEHTGHAGDFRAIAVSDTGDPVIIHHGAVVIATGGGMNKTRSYHYGEDDRITTIAAFREMVDSADPSLKSLKTVAMILCADSREEPFNYCSRICCLKTLETAIALKEERPDMKIFIFYRDIMTYGRSEAVYTRAREKGIFFVNYTPGEKPRVSIDNDRLILEAHDAFSGFDMALNPDMVCLAPGLVPGSGRSMAKLLDLDLTPEGFVREADYKWRPVDTGREGIFVCGLARAPGRIDEILEDGRAAAARAARILQRDLLVPSPVSAQVRDTACSRCGICIGVCPYGARYHSLVDNRVLVDAAACQGCGSCAVACPNSATVISGFEDTAIMEALESVL